MNHRILIVEDDDAQIGILERWLQKAGYAHVEAVGTAAAALAMMDHSWDLVISDIQLPDRDGIELAHQLRERCPGCPILLMTGHLSTEVTIRALNHRVEGFLAKPIDKDAFCAKVLELTSDTQRADQRLSHARVLAIGAHPDDVEIGCGGILLKHRDAGDEIHILTLSNGERGGATGVRCAESHAAAAMLTAKLRIESLRDAEISEGPQTISAITNLVQQVRPTVVYSHSAHDAHQDHRNVHHATIVATRGVPRLHCYQSPSSTIEFTPSKFVDISRNLTEKQDLISCYQSQRQTRRYLKRSMIASTAEYWGRFAEFGHVEPLEIVRSA